MMATTVSKRQSLDLSDNAVKWANYKKCARHILDSWGIRLQQLEKVLLINTANLALRTYVVRDWWNQ
jgi:hypothetical protein